MHPRDSLKHAFDLINQTVRACYDGNASIRVLGPLLVAEQNLRAEVGPEAIEAGAAAYEQVSARERPRLLATFLGELRWKFAAAYASAAASISRLMSAVWRADAYGGGSGWAPGMATLTVAAFAGYMVLTTPSPRTREGTQVAVANTQAETVAPSAQPAQTRTNAAQSTEASSNVVAVATPAPRPRRVRARRAARPAPVEAPVDSSVQESEEIKVRPPSSPVWARMPSAWQLAELYPPRARVHGREGEARLYCMVIDGGRLDCARIGETSRSFGYAAMLVSRTFRHARRRADGSNAIGTPVQLRIVFRLDEQGNGDAAPRPRLIVQTSGT